MLVKDCMTRHPVMISSKAAAAEAQRVMAEAKTRYLPVVGDGKRLRGLVTRSSLALKADTIGSLNVWEITRYLSNLKVRDVMTRAKDVITIGADNTVERAAHIMNEHHIGCLPVVEGEVVVGLLTDYDLLQSFQMMLALPKPGVRVTVRMPDRKGEFAKLVKALGDNDMGLMGVGVYPTPKGENEYDAVLKIPNTTPDKVRRALSNVPDQSIVDLREIV